MGRRTRIEFLVIALLVALVPLRAVAWSAMPCCESGESSLAKPLKGAQESMPCHESEPASESEESCAFCAVHCVSGAQVLQSSAPDALQASSPEPIEFTSRSWAGVVVGLPERPPLVS